MEYETLNKRDQLLLARDALRGRESDHFRISLTNEPRRDIRLREIEGEVKKLKKVIEALEAALSSGEDGAGIVVGGDIDGNLQLLTPEGKPFDPSELPVTDPASPVSEEELTPQQKAARTRKRNAEQKRLEEEEAEREKKDSEKADVSGA